MTMLLSKTTRRIRITRNVTAWTEGGDRGVDLPAGYECAAVLTVDGYRYALTVETPSGEALQVAVDVRATADLQTLTSDGTRAKRSMRSGR